MERQFTIPIAVAALLHGGLFLGLHPTTVVRPPPIASVAFKPQPAPPDTIEWVVPRADRDEDVIITSTAGSPDTNRHLDEPLPAADNSNRIAIHIPPSSPASTLGDSPFIKPNFPLGIGGEEGSDRPIVAAIRLDHTPVTRVQPSPEYPTEARHNGTSGEVVVQFVVDETGRVLDPRAIRSSDPLFEEAACRAVAKWRFEPGKHNGMVVRFRMSVPIQFSLNE
jgi:periplasmic protein TonB